jgi:hypothetical protein
MAWMVGRETWGGPSRPRWRLPSLRSGLSSAGIDKHLADRARKSPLGGGDDNGRPKTEKEP